MGTVGCEATGEAPIRGNSSSPKLSCGLGSPHGAAPDGAGPTPAAVDVAGPPGAGSEPTMGSPGASDGHPAPATTGTAADGVGNPADGVGNPADGDGKPADGDGKPADGDGKPTARRGDGKPGLGRAGKPASPTRLGTWAPLSEGRSCPASTAPPRAPMLGSSTSANGDSGCSGRGCCIRRTGSGRSSSSSRLPGALSLGDSTVPRPAAVRAGAGRGGGRAWTAAGRSRSPKPSSIGGLCPDSWRGSIGAGKSTSPVGGLAAPRAPCPNGFTTAGRSDSSDSVGDATGARGGGGAGGGGNGGRTRTGGGGRRRGGGGGPPRGCSRTSEGSASKATGGAMPSMVALFGCCDGTGRAPGAAPVERGASVGGST